MNKGNAIFVDFDDLSDEEAGDWFRCHLWPQKAWKVVAIWFEREMFLSGFFWFFLDEAPSTSGERVLICLPCSRRSQN